MDYIKHTIQRDEFEGFTGIEARTIHNLMKENALNVVKTSQSSGDFWISTRRIPFALTSTVFPFLEVRDKNETNEVTVAFTLSITKKRISFRTYLMSGCLQLTLLLLEPGSHVFSSEKP